MTNDAMTSECPMTNDHRAGAPANGNRPWSLDIGAWSFIGHWSLVIGHFLFLASLTLLSPHLSANPVGMTVTRGSATATQNGAQLNVQASANAVLNWSSFNVQRGETTTFIQP